MIKFISRPTFESWDIQVRQTELHSCIDGVDKSSLRAITREMYKVNGGSQNQFVEHLMLFKKGPYGFSIGATRAELFGISGKILKKLQTLSSKRHPFPLSKKIKKNST